MCVHVSSKVCVLYVWLCKQTQEVMMVCMMGVLMKKRLYYSENDSYDCEYVVKLQIINICKLILNYTYIM